MNSENTCAAILAGGGSTRMGEDKGNLIVGGFTVEERIMEELGCLTSFVVLNKNKKSLFEIPTIPDVYEDAGPLGGLHAVIEARNEEWFIVSACDTPFIDRNVYQHLMRFICEGTQAVIPVYDGRFQPLSGIYHKSVSDELTALLQAGHRKVAKLLDNVNTYYVTDFNSLPKKTVENHFFNMNTPGDYELAQRMVKNQARSRHFP
nr:molybdenum cofactor guanylyltransferase [Halobacillus sp. BBL2006]